MSIGSKNKIEILPEIQGKVLKAAREKLRLEISELATKACLSKKHITELEQGGVSSFYSEVHKITVAKKVAKLLQVDEALVLLHPNLEVTQQESLPFDAAIEEPASSPVTQNIKVVKESQSVADEVKPAASDTNQKTPKQAVSQPDKVTLENIQTGGQMDASRPKAKRSRGGLVSVLLLILVLGGLYSSKNEIIALFIPLAEEPRSLAVEESAPQDPKTEEANPANPGSPSSPSGVAPNSATPAIATAAAVAPMPSDVGCPKPDVNVSDQLVFEPTKPGNFVHVNSKARQIVCVIDGTGKSSMQSIDAGTGHTFTGKAPFTILTNGLSETAIYFQGKLARPANEQSRTMRLLEGQVN